MAWIVTNRQQSGFCKSVWTSVRALLPPGLPGLLGLLCAAALCVGCADTSEDIHLVIEGREAFANGHYILAEERFEAYLHEAPQGGRRYEAWSRLLDVAQNIRDDKPKAAGILEAMVVEYGENPKRARELLTRLAEVYEAMGKRDKAADTWGKFIALPGLDTTAKAQTYRKLAALRQIQSQYDLALDALEACRRVAPNDAEQAQCLYEQGLVLGFMESYDRAEQSLRDIRTLTEAPKALRAQSEFLLADLMEQQGKTEEAIRTLESIMDDYPNRKALETRLSYLKSKE